MLRFITELPTDKPIGGVHCVPILDGNLMMVWDQEEKVLTTIGGRLEPGESINEFLDREVLEEAGLEVTDDRIPFASWCWKETNSYTVYFLTRVKKLVEMPKGFEKKGYVIMNFRTAIEMIKAKEGRGERIEIITRAGILTSQFEEGNIR